MNEVTHQRLFVKVFGITLLSLLVLISIAGASPFAYIEGEAPSGFNADSNVVSVIDTATNTVTDTIKLVNDLSLVNNLGSHLTGIVISPDGKKVYVTFVEVPNGVGPVYNSTVYVIDTATNTITSTVKIGYDSIVNGIVPSPDGKILYVTNYTAVDSAIFKIDTATNTVKNVVKVGPKVSPYRIAISPNGKWLYATDLYDSVYVINTSSNTVKTSISVGTEPSEIIVTPNGKDIYVTNWESNTVSVIDTTTNKVIDTVDVGIYPNGVAVTPDGKKVFVTNGGSDTVSVIDTTTNKVIDTMNMKNSPYGVAITPDGKKAYVTIWNNSVSVIDTTTYKVITTEKVVTYPRGVAITPKLKPVQPVAVFLASLTTGKAPLIVKFTEKSTGSPTSWFWNFGDKTTSISRNPTHKYTKAGKYIVSLKVTNSAGSNTESMSIKLK